MFVEKTKEEIAKMTHEELTAYNKEKASAKAEAKKESKTSNPSAGLTEKHFQEQGKKSKENRSNGGEDVKVSLINKTKIRFKEDFGFMKKGHVQEVSDTALAIYEKAGVIEKI